MLPACGTPRVVTKTVPVEIPVPVLKALPAEITKDCPPRYVYPAGDLTIEALIDRALALEIALAICRNQLEIIRAAQP